jgi:hypothetical protein
MEACGGVLKIAFRHAKKSQAGQLISKTFAPDSIFGRDNHAQIQQTYRDKNQFKASLSAALCFAATPDILLDMGYLT